MTQEEITSEIYNTLLHVPDESLQTILDYIKTVQDESQPDRGKPVKNLWAMVLDDEELLGILANHRQPEFASSNSHPVM